MVDAFAKIWLVFYGHGRTQRGRVAHDANGLVGELQGIWPDGAYTRICNASDGFYPAQPEAG